MLQAVLTNLLLYADDCALMFQHKFKGEIEKRLDISFAPICKLIFGKKMSIHFGEDKPKRILFGAKWKLKKVGKLNASYKGIDINNTQV